MEPLVPNRHLMRFEIPLHYRRPGFDIDGNTDKWDDTYLLPDLGLLDDAPDWAYVWMAWNETGISLACYVDQKERPPKCRPDAFWKGDNLRLMADMRDTRTVKRATRFCQHFYFLPTGGGPDGKQPVAGNAKVHRAREDAPRANPENLRVAAKITPDSWALEAFIPADCLAGYDPAEHRRIGFYYIIEDGEWGRQFLTVGDDLYWYIDPSTWATGVLVE